MNKAFCLLVISSASFLLSACDEIKQAMEPDPCYGYYTDVNGRCFGFKVDEVSYAKVFNECTTKLSEARKGANYSTHDDEDYDEAIEACDRAAYDIARVREYRTTNN